MRAVGVAVLDSGVNPRHPHVRGLMEGRSFVPGEKSESCLDTLGHGTAVAGAICEKCESVELYVAKIFSTTLATSIDVLMTALDWALARPVSLINLSLGTANSAHRPAFDQRVKQAAEKGIVIVSAAGALPGSIPGAIGARLDDTVPRDAIGPDYAACGWPRPIPGRPPDHNLHGVSFAVANVTGVLARRIAMRPEG